MLGNNKILAAICMEYLSPIHPKNGWDPITAIVVKILLIDKTVVRYSGNILLCITVYLTGAKQQNISKDTI